MEKVLQTLDENDAEELWSIELDDSLVFLEHNGKVVQDHLDDECSIARDVGRITQFVKSLLNTKRSLFAIAPSSIVRPMRPNSRCIQVGKGGKCFLRCLEIDLDRILDKYPELGKCNRYFGIYLDAVTREVEFFKGPVPFVVAARDCWLNSRDINFFEDGVLALFVEYANKAIEQIKLTGNGRSFKAWVADIERQPRQNEESLLSLVDACLAVNHHALVLRFDLGYAQIYSDPERSVLMAVSYEEMRGHRVRLRRFLKRELKHRLLPGACKGMVFAIKLEYGLDKGYHFHVVAMLNGDVVRNDGAISEMICNYWRHEITRGKGGAYNCNFMRYKRRGIGSIRYSDVDKLTILRTVVIPYVAKVDYYRDMVVPKRHRTFWSSHPPKVQAVPKGRKRKVVGEGADSE